ncbi:hypothetical protein [Empedobacter brevis]|uniref:hypothetical protein n=1 Tax=Empedobacter brevis TaxID=247 RepID=UPI0028A213B3|nr:hypothetical protein [Empedobacter brevis]
MKKSSLFYLILFLLFFNCKKEETSGQISLEMTNISMNKKNHDFPANTFIYFDFNLINNSQNKIIFIASARGDDHRKSRLILLDTISHKSIDIITGNVSVLKRGEVTRILGFINLKDGESEAFFDNKSYDKDRNFSLDNINKKLKSCKVYYIQKETDLNIMKKQGYKQLSFIKDSLKVNESLYIH